MLSCTHAATVLVLERGKDATRLVANPALPLPVVGGAKKAYYLYKNSSPEPGGNTVIHADLEAMVVPKVDPALFEYRGSNGYLLFRCVSTSVPRWNLLPAH